MQAGLHLFLNTRECGGNLLGKKEIEDPKEAIKQTWQEEMNNRE